MTLNDMIEDGIAFQGQRVVTALTDDAQEAQTLYEGDDEWNWDAIGEEWGDWHINYIHPQSMRSCAIEIELDNPNARF